MCHRLLIVDDSATTRAIIKRAIQLAHVPVEQMAEAANGKEALLLMATTRFDLVLADLNMPEMGGLEMTRRMLADPATASVPVIVISAEPNVAMLVQMHDSGIKGYLRKPFTPEGIRNLIGPVLGVAHA
ncbi:MAG: response regulator [Bacillota bacterium]